MLIEHGLKTLTFQSVNVALKEKKFINFDFQSVIKFYYPATFVSRIKQKLAVASFVFQFV